MAAPQITFRDTTTGTLVTSLALIGASGGPISSNSSSVVVSTRIYNNAGTVANTAYTGPIANVADAQNVRLAAYDDTTNANTSSKPVVGTSGTTTPWVHVAETDAGEETGSFVASSPFSTVENINSQPIGGVTQHLITMSSDGSAGAILRANTLPLNAGTNVSGYAQVDLRVDVPANTSRQNISFGFLVLYEFI